MEKILKFQRQTPDWEEEKEFRAWIGSVLLDAGLSAMEAADLLLYAAYDLHRYAEGADEQREGWQERSARSFQKTVARFCVENAYDPRLECDDPDCIRLPYP